MNAEHKLDKFLEEKNDLKSLIITLNKIQQPHCKAFCKRLDGRLYEVAGDTVSDTIDKLYKELLS